jgi:hypothetical protein
MSSLKLCFQKEEEAYKWPSLTKYEINELAIAAQCITAIVNVLEWFIEPIETYLENYAGEPAEPEEPKPAA